MKFGIESKTYKDTFEVRKIQEIKDAKTNSSTNKTYNGKGNHIIFNFKLKEH